MATAEHLAAIEQQHQAVRAAMLALIAELTDLQAALPRRVWLMAMDSHAVRSQVLGYHAPRTGRAYPEQCNTCTGKNWPCYYYSRAALGLGLEPLIGDTVP